MNLNSFGRTDADTHLSSLDAEYGDLDIVANHQCLTHSPSQYQHDVFLVQSGFHTNEAAGRGKPYFYVLHAPAPGRLAEALRRSHFPGVPGELLRYGKLRRAVRLLTRQLRLSDANIALEEVGDGLPVLLLHGFPANRLLWSRVAPVLAERYRVLIPDLIGYGSSEAPAGCRVDMASQARWMFELLDVLGIARVTVVAHDVGSAAAQIMVAMAPQRIRGLVVLDGVYAGEWAMDAIASIQKWAPADAHRIHPVLARRLGKSAEMRDMLASCAGERGGLRLIQAAQDLDPRQTESLGEALGSSGVPALVLWGDQDTFLSIDAVGQPLAAQLGAKLVRLPGGHFTPIDCPAAVAAAVLGFIASLPTAV